LLSELHGKKHRDQVARELFAAAARRLKDGPVIPTKNEAVAA
jgi:hypothetical protein